MITAVLPAGQAGNKAEERKEIPIHKSRDTSSVRKVIAEWLESRHHVAKGAFQVLYGQAPLVDGSLRDAGITEDETLVIEVAAGVNDTHQS